MTRVLAVLPAALLLAVVAAPVLAQGAAVAAAMARGEVGEGADGFLALRGGGGALRAEVEAINIKRREAYTRLAQQRGVTVQDVAAAVGCQTLRGRVEPGQAYRLRDGSWHVREAGSAVPLPDYCA